MRSEQKKILKNFSWLLLGKIVRYSLGLFISIWTARYLKPELFGVLNYCIAFVGFFVGVASLGTPQILIRQFVKYPTDSNKILGAGILLMGIGGLISTILCLSIIYLFKGNDNLTIILVSILCVKLLVMPQRAFWCYFESILKAKVHVISSMLSYILISIFRIIALMTAQSVKVFALLIVLELVFTSILMIFYFIKKTDLAQNLKLFEFDLDISTNLLKDSYPLIFSIAATTLLLRADQIMVREICNDNAAGIYAAAVRLTELWYFLPVIIQSSVFPSIVKSMNVQQIFDEKLIKLFRIVIILGIVIALPISLFSNTVVALLYGEDYFESGVVLSILIWAVLFIGINQIRNSYLYSKNFAKTHFKIILLALVLNLIGNYYLIHEFGAAGAAISTVITYGFASVFANAFFKNSRDIIKLILRSILDWNYTIKCL